MTKYFAFLLLLSIIIQIIECSSHIVVHACKELIQTCQIDQRTSILVNVYGAFMVHHLVFLEAEGSCDVFDEIDMGVTLLFEVTCKI